MIQWKPIDTAPLNIVVLTDVGTGIKVRNQWYLCDMSGNIPSCGDWGIEVSEINPAKWMEMPE